MKFKSIQFSVAALAGAIVLSVVAALVVYAMFSGARTQDMVQQRTQGPSSSRSSSSACAGWHRTRSARSCVTWKRRY